MGKEKSSSSSTTIVQRCTSCSASLFCSMPWFLQDLSHSPYHSPFYTILILRHRGAGKSSLNATAYSYATKFLQLQNPQYGCETVITSIPSWKAERCCAIAQRCESINKRQAYRLYVPRSYWPWHLPIAWVWFSASGLPDRGCSSGASVQNIPT